MESIESIKKMNKFYKITLLTMLALFLVGIATAGTVINSDSITGLTNLSADNITVNYLSGFKLWGYDINSNGQNIWNGTQNIADYTYIIRHDPFNSSNITAVDGLTGAILITNPDMLTVLNAVRENNTTIKIINDGTEYTINNKFSIDGYDNLHLVGIGYPVLNFSTSPTESHSIYFQSSTYTESHIEISGLKITYSKSSAIIGNGSFVKIFDNIIISPVLQGINIQGTDCNVYGNIIIGNNDFGYMNEFGIVIGGNALRIHIHDNNVRGFGEGGIQWGYSGSNVLITDNIISACVNGIEIGGRNVSTYYSKDCIISSNLITNISSVGIIVKRKPTYVNHSMHDFNIIGNTILRASASGILVNNVSYGLVADNMISNTSYGIFVDADVNDFVFQDNYIMNTSTQGISVSSDNNSYISNTIINPTYDGIAFSISNAYVNTQVICNIILNAGRDAIRHPSTNIILSQNVGHPGFDWGVKSAAPTPNGAGDEYFNSIDNIKYCYNGSTWNALY